MVPLTSIFQRLERTAVSLAIQQNKKIEIIMDGSHIEIDKIIIQKGLNNNYYATMSIRIKG